MKSTEKFKKEIKAIFPIRGRVEKDFLNKVFHSIDEYDEQFPNNSYQEIIENFGEPKEIVMSYYLNVEGDYILKKMKLRKFISWSSILIVFTVIVYMSYCMITDYYLFEKTKAVAITDCEIVTEEE